MADICNDYIEVWQASGLWHFADTKGNTIRSSNEKFVLSGAIEVRKAKGKMVLHSDEGMIQCSTIDEETYALCTVEKKEEPLEPYRMKPGW